MAELRPDETVGKEFGEPAEYGADTQATDGLIDERRLQEGSDDAVVATEWVTGPSTRDHAADYPLPDEEPAAHPANPPEFDVETPAAASPPIVPPIIGGPPSSESGEDPDEPEPINPGIDQFDSEIPTDEQKRDVAGRFEALGTRTLTQHATYADIIDSDMSVGTRQVLADVTGEEVPYEPGVRAAAVELQTQAPDGDGTLRVRQWDSPRDKNISIVAEDSSVAYTYEVRADGTVVRTTVDFEADETDPNSALAMFEGTLEQHVVGPAEMAHLEELLERAEPQRVRFAALDDAVARLRSSEVSVQQSQVAGLAFRSDIENLLTSRAEAEHTSTHAFHGGTARVTVGVGPEHLVTGGDPSPVQAVHVPFVRVELEQDLGPEVLIGLGAPSVPVGFPDARLVSSLTFRVDQEGWFWSEGSGGIETRDGIPLFDLQPSALLANDHMRRLVRNFVRKPLF